MDTHSVLTHETGEPRDLSLLLVCIGYLVLTTLFIVSFVGMGYGGALFGMILLITRLLLILMIPVGIVVAIIALRRGVIDVAIAAIVAVPLAILALILLAPL